MASSDRHFDTKRASCFAHGSIGRPSWAEACVKMGKVLVAKIRANAGVATRDGIWVVRSEGEGGRGCGGFVRYVRDWKKWRVGVARLGGGCVDWDVVWFISGNLDIVAWISVGMTK